MPVKNYCRLEPCTASPDESIEDAAVRMDARGIGSLVVVVDDIVAEIARELGDVRAGLRGAVLGARRTSQRRRRREEAAATIEELVGKTDFDFSPSDLAEQYYGDEQKIFTIVET